jgi:hypothetical protein
MKNLINEGLERGDLKRLIHNELHIDEFKSKLGSDSEVCVISFKVNGKEPGTDLVNFIEKGYPWVIDADVSSGEMDDGDYIVFVEAERTRELPEQIVALIEEILNLTDQTMAEWRFKYHGKDVEHELTAENIARLVPVTPEEYNSKFGSQELDKLKTAAGVSVDTKAPKNEFTEALRAAAGIL